MSIYTGKVMYMYMTRDHHTAITNYVDEYMGLKKKLLYNCFMLVKYL